MLKVNSTVVKSCSLGMHFLQVKTLLSFVPIETELFVEWAWCLVQNANSAEQTFD